MHPSTLINPSNPHYANAINSPISINELHHLGHLNFHIIWEIVSKGVVTGILLDKLSTPDFCSVYVQGKAHHQAFSKKSQTSFIVYGEKVIVNLWGLAEVTLPGGNCYYQLYCDLFTYKDCIDFLRKKLEAFQKYL